ncbi:MAG: cytochrome c4 [Halothiobacillus sp. 24-54-40]|jgi:cytochrome c553|nr:c-type cytochrome [Halothiobacillaceae bacterium]OYV47116.1 MAG: cytochrome c4 [Halothiobacillus sp. 20-53-49]OYY40809.1 MAG: cytochrome c4 [Halothiobacillus sp. 35-54-62]OYY56079.1 MAG: cytochrome c4 [Halothiobacillus sp. 28-55-5]OYZ86289.1 MAG: cytochrome c4 [Halothiobacillus sp. 24-54-40]OZA80125.1 MAG: cytochrome c4 [Halothiobacillus sp. 39-53-45]HQS03417.1 c-type cytochrome [Halothiobacillus sp.]
MRQMPLQTIRLMTGVCLLAGISSIAQAAPPPEAASCAACHGAQGDGLPAANYPRLAGLPAHYIAEQLKYFADGTRQNAIMAGMAKPLTPAQITILADYYAGLPVAMPAPAASVAPILLSRGQQLAEFGDWKAGIPACFRCHAAGGVGVPPYFPPIAGQSAKYLADQITAWQTGTRKGDPQGLMHSVALRMTEADTQAVTAYLAAIKPAAAVLGDSQPLSTGGVK